MSYARKIIDKFGGIRKAAHRLKLPASTVQYWSESGSIPDKHKPDVLRAAVEDKLGVTRDDFFPPFVGRGAVKGNGGGAKRTGTA